jgi:hypothetical protein
VQAAGDDVDHIEDDNDSRFPPMVRKIAVGTIGSAVTATGVVMLVTPGPGLLVTLAGLGILSREFPMAQRGIDRIRGWVRREDR